MIDITSRTNAERAASAHRALRTYVDECEGGEADQDYHLADLLADLAHYADTKGWSFKQAIRDARMHYDEEVEDEIEQ